MSEDLKLKQEITRPDFHCRDCGEETNCAPDPPARAVCEQCCGDSDDHDYRYDREAREESCVNCLKRRDYEGD